MKKAEIKKEVENIYRENIHHKGLPPAYKIGMTVFKRELVKFIASLKITKPWAPLPNK